MNYFTPVLVPPQIIGYQASCLTGKVCFQTNPSNEKLIERQLVLVTFV